MKFYSPRRTLEKKNKTWFEVLAETLMLVDRLRVPLAFMRKKSRSKDRRAGNWKKKKIRGDKENCGQVSKWEKERIVVEKEALISTIILNAMSFNLKNM